VYPDEIDAGVCEDSLETAFGFVQRFPVQTHLVTHDQTYMWSRDRIALRSRDSRDAHNKRQQ
jgi:hypothetical protein